MVNIGMFNNVIINENCVIRGKLFVNQIEGDFVKIVGKVFFCDFCVLKCWLLGIIIVRVYDDQLFNWQIVILVVVFSGVRYEQENSDIYLLCCLIVKKNGVEIYNCIVLDNMLIYSGVIDMFVGCGYMMLEFFVLVWWVNGWYFIVSISDLLVVVMKKVIVGIMIS